MKIILRLCFVSLFFLQLLFLSYSSTFATVLFQDNFDNPTESATRWTTIGPQLYNGDGTEAYWTFENGMYGISITNRGSQFNETVPIYWNNDWNNYIYEVDFKLVRGVDTNLVFRLTNHTRWYGIHGINNENGIYFQKVGQSWSGEPPVRSFKYELDTFYRIKTIVNNENLKVSIKNSVTNEEIDLWDVVDYGTILTSGKIGLQVGPGANPNSEVWFDNVMVRSLDELTGTPTPTQTPVQISTPTPSSTPTATPTPTPTPTQTPTSTLTPTPTPTNTPTPTPTPTPPTPIVFLPGLGASFNYQEMILGISDLDGWRMTPGANVYNNFLKTFSGKDYFSVFFYDWRKPVLDNAQKLNDYIKNDIQPWNNKVDLIGHSLGGLVARTCIQKTANNCYAEKLITIGSPHFGAVDSYPALEGGDVWRSGPTRLLYELFIHYNQKPGETRRQTIERIAPVLKDLLPNFDYLIKNGLNLPPSNLSFKNELLSNISDLSSLYNLTKTIIGRNFDTVDQIILTEPNWLDKALGNWPDGKPVDKIFTLEGDTSVLIKSSSFNNPLIENFTFNLDHGGIISQNAPIQKILSILNLNLSPITNESIEDQINYLVFFVKSPIKIIINDLPDGSLAEDKLIIIPNPESKNYHVQLDGISNGRFQLSVGQIFGQNTLWSDYWGEIQSGQNKTYEFSINNQNPSNNPLIDPNGTAINDSLNALIKKLKEEINNLKLKPAILKRILQILAKINPKYPEESIYQVGLLRQVIADYEKNKIITSEKALNLRFLCSQITENLEYLAFLKPKNTKKSQALDALKQAENTKKGVGQNLSKNPALIYQEGEDKLTKANNNYKNNLYYQTKIFSTESNQLFKETRILK